MAPAPAAWRLWFDQRPGKVSLAAAYGNFKGASSGLALGLGYAPTADFRFNAAAIGSPDRSDCGASIGASWTLN